MLMVVVMTIVPISKDSLSSLDKNTDKMNGTKRQLKAAKNTGNHKEPSPRGSSRTKKKRLKKQTLSAQGGGGVNPSSLIKPKITGFSNHSEMAFGHHNMNDNALELAWLGPPISSFPPNTSLYPI